MLVVIMILKIAEIFQVLFIVSLFCAWNINTVEINCIYLKVKSAKCLCLLPAVLVLVLRITGERHAEIKGRILR